jgi:hypothetical protein
VKLVAIFLLAACSGGEAAPKKQVPPPKVVDKEIVKKLDPIKDALCVTKGTAAIGSRITDPTMRAVAKGSLGESASLTFKYAGDTEAVRELAGGQARRQIGLKLRAQDGCNLVYVMWRLDPKPKLDISVKLNPGKKTHKECGADGYVKVKPAKGKLPGVPVLAIDDVRTLKAEIIGDELTVWIDELISWKGTLPEAARALDGPAGIRSDNFAFELVGFSAPTGPAAKVAAKCTAEDDA